MQSTLNDFFLSFRTEKSEKKISYSQSLMFLGSCFAQEIGGMLRALHFDTTINPLGIAFNPWTIKQHITSAVNSAKVDPRFFVQRDEKFFSLEYHSNINGKNPDVLTENILSGLRTLHQRIETANWIFLTLGTAWVYRHIDLDGYVASCHKLPQSHFLKKLMTTDEILGSLSGTVHLIRSINPKVQIVFTVSPVKHSKDGLWQNNVSKGRLHSGIFETIAEQENCHYFESFEWLNDVLRDYRFYKEDKVHPNGQAISFIFERFQEKYFDVDTERFIKKVSAYQKLAQHRPHNPEAIKQHQEKLEKNWEKLSEEYSLIKRVMDQ